MNRLLSLLGSLLLTNALHAAELSYNQDIRPILSDNCFYCHGFDPKNRKADLRLDTFEGATANGAIVPGHLSKSEAWNRILSDDPEEVMPPPKSHKKLTSAQKDVLRRWIEGGAKYEPHWAFVPIRRAVPPSVSLADWPMNPIDPFVLARLEREGIAPSPAASKETLLRRVTLDLTGLPPTLRELDAFLSDSSPNAYEAAVDRLLASPHYGEHMALPWLDAARYADTNGYQVDRDREMWPWRDWVIQAFNQNQPFDQFTIEQLAGDLLPNPTLSQRIATGFNRNHMINEEGGIIPEEFLAEYAADRVETPAAVWLGQTFNCCRCHDHKYDPFTQRDFYSLKAFFHNVPEQGAGNRAAKPNASAPPVLKLPVPELDSKKSTLESDLAQLQASRQQILSQPSPGFSSWIQNLRSETVPWERLHFQTVENHGLPTELAEGAVKTGIQVGDDFWSFSAITAPTHGPITAIRLVGEPDGEDATFRIHRFDVTAIHGETQTPLKLRPAEFETSLPIKVIQPLLKTGNRAPHPLRLKSGKRESLVFRLDTPLEAKDLATKLRITVGTRANTGWVRWHVEATSQDPAQLVSTSIFTLAKKPEENRTIHEQKLLKDAYEATLPELRGIDEKILATTQQIEELDLQYPASMVMEEMASPRDTFILVRGAYDKPGEKVFPATPAILPPMPAQFPKNRLGLAEWLVSPEHPLTARVTVNRLWQQFFGSGLVKTSEDFGAQGEAPSHPELLDWLASEFIRTGWDVKQMVRLIVTSATYRQTSHIPTAIGSKDPENRLLARGPRFRLTAETLRDQALALSGLLVPRIGGPPVRPYHPEGIYETLAPTSADTVKRYIQDHGEALYRRTLYTYWKRSIPHPAMLAFGTPFRETCTLQRPRSNTPLQALNLMNDVTYLEASRFLAQRMMTEGGSTVDERLKYGFRMVLSRHPSPTQLAILRAAFDRNLASYKRDPAGASALLANGDRPSDPTLDRQDLAALTTLASTLLCMDETLSKN